MFNALDLSQFISLLFLFCGIALIIFSMFWQSRLKERPPIKIIVEKLGINLSLDTLSLLILGGFLVVGIGGALLYKGHETRLTPMTTNFTENRKHPISPMEKVKEKSKNYDFTIKLSFPEGDFLDFENAEVTAFVHRKHELNASTPYNKTQLAKGPGGISIEVFDLKPHDQLRLEVKDKFQGEVTRWVSERRDIPMAFLKMRKAASLQPKE